MVYTMILGTVAPILVLESRESVNIWEDVNLIVPIVAAIIALTVVIGVAVCVCVKKRHVAGNYGKNQTFISYVFQLWYMSYFQTYFIYSLNFVDKFLEKQRLNFMIKCSHIKILYLAIEQHRHIAVCV